MWDPQVGSCYHMHKEREASEEMYLRLRVVHSESVKCACRSINTRYGTSLDVFYGRRRRHLQGGCVFNGRNPMQLSSSTWSATLS